MLDLRNINTKNNDILIDGQYTLKERLGGGSFGQLYSAFGKENKKLIAVKLEQRMPNKNPTLIREAKVLSDLLGEKGFPTLYGYGKQEAFNYIIINLLGLNLDKLLKLCGQKFSLHTVLMLADQLLTRIETLHHKGFLHRDIKPDNFCMGLGNQGDVLYLIDFGLTRSYKEPSGEHIPYRDQKGLVGTARYASINTHHGIEQSRRDDLESIGYSLIYFIKGELPWQNVRVHDKKEKYRLIANIKMNTPVEILCKGLPAEFLVYMNYVRSLEFTDEPDYKYLKRLFRTLFIKNNFTMDYNYDWLETSEDKDNEMNKKYRENRLQQTSRKYRFQNEEMEAKFVGVKKNLQFSSKEPKNDANKMFQKGLTIQDKATINKQNLKVQHEHNLKENAPSPQTKTNEVTKSDKRLLKTQTMGERRKSSKAKKNKTKLEYKEKSTTSDDSSKAIYITNKDDMDVATEFTTNNHPSVKIEFNKSLVAKNLNFGQDTRKLFSSVQFLEESAIRCKTVPAQDYSGTLLNNPIESPQLIGLKRMQESLILNKLRSSIVFGK